MGKRILVILGHPLSESLCGALADSYVAAAKQAGAEVQYLKLGELQFEPLLHHGYHVIQQLEPDLLAAQQAILRAEQLVFVYPNWWGTSPALLKGFIDRVFLPGFAFKYRENSPFWDKLLGGRSARLLVTMDTPPWYYRWIYRMPGHNQMKRTVLGFCGIKPVRVSSFGSVKSASGTRRRAWLNKVARLAQKDAASSRH